MNTGIETFAAGDVINLIPWVLENENGEGITPLVAIETVFDGDVNLGVSYRALKAKLDALLTDKMPTGFGYDNIYKVMRDIAALVTDSNIPRFVIMETLPAVASRNAKTTYAKSNKYVKDGVTKWYIERMEDNTGKAYDIKDASVDQKIADLEAKMNATFINGLLAGLAPASTTLHAKYLTQGSSKHELGISIKYNYASGVTTATNLDTLYNSAKNIRVKFTENATKHASFPISYMTAFVGYFEQEFSSSSNGFQKIITDNGEEITRVAKTATTFGPWKLTYNSGGNNEVKIGKWTIKPATDDCLGFFYNPI